MSVLMTKFHVFEKKKKKKKKKKKQVKWTKD